MGKDRLSGVFRFRAQPVIGLRFHIEGAIYQPLLGQHGLEHGDIGRHIEGQILVGVVQELLEGAVEHSQGMLDLAARGGDVLALHRLLFQVIVGGQQLHRRGKIVGGQAIEAGDDRGLPFGSGEDAAHHLFDGHDALAHGRIVDGLVQAAQLAQVRGKLMEDEYTGYIEELAALPDKIARVLEDKGRIQWFAAKFANARDIFFLGRGADYAASLEGSLKMKEISYIHSEAYAAGELKHGTISLVEDNTLVIGVLTQSDLYEKTISNMAECKARGAYLMGLTCYGHYSIEDTADFTVYIPKTAPCFTGLLAIVPLQLLGYYTSVARGLDVDKPRNLAKSVTVE